MGRPPIRSEAGVVDHPTPRESGRYAQVSTRCIASYYWSSEIDERSLTFQRRALLDPVA
jgi:hypothetical protein